MAMKIIYYILFLFLLITSCQTDVANDPEEKEWLSIFNGVNVEDWTPKIAGYKLGEDPFQNFILKDTCLTVHYEPQDSFKGAFGHLFYKEPFSFYRIKAKYRFIGKQQNGGQAWAFRNNGLMLHCQPPSTMAIDQGFPSSLELQLLGAYDDGKPRTNLNLCTPGMHVHMGDTLVTQHCINSSFPSSKGGEWADVEALVLGDSLIQHIHNGEVVFEFTKPIIGGGMGAENYSIENTPVTEGYISIQAESHPIQFRNIEVLDLCGCMDKKAKNYKSYYIKANNEKCVY